MSAITPIPITLDKPMGMKITAWGMRRFHDVSGKSIMRGEVSFKDISENELIDLFWACLLWDDSEPEPDRKHIACILFDYYTIPEIETLIVKTFQISFSPKQDDEPKNTERLQS
jgi:hypothetical protein